jgi:hypothetical protein
VLFDIEPLQKISVTIKKKEQNRTMQLLGGEREEPLLPPARPWATEFFGKFGLPSLNRLESNVLYYQANYLVLSLMILLVCISYTRLVLIIAPVQIFMIHFCFFRQSGEMRLFRRVRITKNMVLLSTAVFSVFLILVAGYWKNLIASYATTTFVMGMHMLTRDRQAGRQKTPMSTNRIFDPDEMLRNEMMNNAYTTSANFHANIGNSLDSSQPNRPPNPHEIPRRDFMQSNTATSRITDNVKAEKQKQIRQRVREQYGLS